MFKSIRLILIVSFFLVLLANVVLGITTFVITKSSSGLVAQSIDHDFSGSIEISQIAIATQKIRRYEKEFFMYIGNAEKQNKYEHEWTQVYEQLQQQLNDISFNRSGNWTKSDLNTFVTWREALQAYHKGFTGVVAGVKRGLLNNTLTANSAIQEAKNKFRVLVNGSSEFAAQKYQQASLASAKIKRANNFLFQIVLGSVLASVLLCLIMIFLVPNAIIKPIKLLSNAAAKMSKGDVDQSIPTSVGIKDFTGLAETLERLRISQKTFMNRLANRQI